MMKPPIQVLYETAKELIGKNVKSLQDFQNAMKADKVLREGVEAVCEAMIRYAKPAIDTNTTLIQTIHELKKQIEEYERTQKETIFGPPAGEISPDL